MQTIAAAIQYEPKLFEVAENLGIARALVLEAAGKGASLIVLPELCTSGNVLQSESEAARCCQRAGGEQTEAFCELASLYGVWIAFGYVELYEGKLYNSAAIVSPAGALVLNVRKRNLFGSDLLWATPGDDSFFRTIVTPFGRIGALICGDVTNEDRSSYRWKVPGKQFYKRGSVDTVCLLTNWAADYGFPDASWTGLSESLDTNVVVSNRIGSERDMKYKGGSCVISRGGKVWSNGSSFEDEAVVGGVLL